MQEMNKEAPEPVAEPEQATGEAKMIDEKELEAKFQSFVEKKEILVEDGPEGIKYIMARTATTKADAVAYAEKFAEADRFQEMMRKTYIEGIKEGIITMRRQLAFLGPMYQKGCKIADRVLAVVEKQIKK